MRHGRHRLVSALLMCLSLPAQDVVVPRPRRVTPGEGTVALVGVRCDVEAFAPQVAAFVEAVRRLGADGFCRAPDTPGALLVVRDGAAAAPESAKGQGRAHPIPGGLY